MKLNGLFAHNVKSVLLGAFKLSVHHALWLIFFKVDLILALHNICISIKARRFYSCSREISERVK